MKLIDLLSQAAIIRRLFSKERSMKMLQKPEKILFDNTNIMYALSQEVDQGTLRETFFTDMLSYSHSISMPQKGDLMVDKHLLFEVGGRSKGYKQIANIPDSYHHCTPLGCSFFLLKCIFVRFESEFLRFANAF